MATTATPPEHRFVSNRDESCRMFRNDVFEWMSHVHPAMPLVIFVPVIAAAVWVAAATGQSAADIAGRIVAGIVMWTLTEYVIHRFVFHPPQWVEDDTRRILSRLPLDQAAMPAMPTFRHKFYFLVHGVHHDYPNDSRRLVMPPSVSIPLAILFFLVFRAAFGADAPAMFAGFVAGYLIYDVTHYLTHNGGAHTAYGRYQRKRHFRHHYADSTRDFGVSSPAWDVVWGTLGRNQPRRSA